MKGLILAAVSIAFLVGSVIVGLRAYRGNREYVVFLGSFAASLGLYGLLFVALPPNLGFLPDAAREPAVCVDFSNGLIVLATVFHGFWVFAYVACLGPTMSLLVEMSQRGRRGITTDEALTIFGNDESMNLILRRRLPKLINGGYLEHDYQVYRLLPRGIRIARISLLCKKVVGAE